MVSLRNLWLSIYLGPAIVYVKQHLWEELTISHNLKDLRPDLYRILWSGGLIQDDRLTILGNTIFSCTSLIEYNVKVSTALMRDTIGMVSNINYDLLRKGLGEQAMAQSIDYLSFMREVIPVKPEIILDICGGDGTYLYLLGEMYESDKCFLMDKDTESAILNPHLEDTSRYVIQTGNPLTYKLPIPYRADLVLLNEVLHLKKEGEWWTNCIDSALRNSKPNAHICIGELLPDSTFDWRMRVLTSDGAPINIDTFQDFLARHCSKIFDHNFNYIETDTHWFCILKRVK